ncbi:Uncharacterized conserved protein YbaA, DUF1428 family [Devosia sp. YR412]|uniref:DUF1428 domain-containing protein n=1 Tax=Devosia sp. YR412 TaxID=1881030 RepID=UPI0008C204B6|nr:DUF1428 domain-containing protein [Devosia sp. YR412]SEP78682.1 Uncharacterized conserved protein YbaA, DUF1428 family [Devosia sp. YR412]
MTYISGFVLAVPTANYDKYLKTVEDSLGLFKGYGVTRVIEAWGDDVPEGEVTDFRRAVKATPDETIVFSWHEYPDKATADAAARIMMNDPAMEAFGANMPFDGARMIYGGFAGLHEVGTRGGRPGYVDGSLIPVKTARKDDYRALLERQGAIFSERGATRFVDAWGDNVPDGKLTDFRKAVAATADETVVFSFIEWPSKAVRDAAWQEIYTDPRMHEEDASGDEARRVFGGFVPLLDA